MNLLTNYLLLLSILCFLSTNLWAGGTHKHVKHKHWTNKYDGHFKKYSKRYFGPSMDWHWFKAQGIAESGLKANAKSNVGAVGIMQIMPATFKEIQSKNSLIKSLSDPRWNIAAGIYYDRYLYKRWKQRVPQKEKLRFTFASYNAGFGRVSRALKKAGVSKSKPLTWSDVAPKAPGQTRHYVKRIDGLMRTQ